MSNRVKYLMITLAVIISLTLIIGATRNLPVNAQRIVTGEMTLEDDGPGDRNDRIRFADRGRDERRLRSNRPRR